MTQMIDILDATSYQHMECKLYILEEQEEIAEHDAYIRLQQAEAEREARLGSEAMLLQEMYMRGL